MADLCKNCHHIIARHEYTFSIMDEFQVNVYIWYIIVGRDNKCTFVNINIVLISGVLVNIKGDHPSLLIVYVRRDTLDVH